MFLPSPPPLPPPPGLVDSKVDCVKGGVEGGFLHQQQAVGRLLPALLAGVLQMLLWVNSMQLVHLPALLPVLRILLLLPLLPHPALEEELQVRLVGPPTPYCWKTSTAAHHWLAAAQTRGRTEQPDFGSLP